MASLQEAQQVVKDFTLRNGWSDVPNIDKFDHLHEELLEMSRYLRYKDVEERKAIVAERKEVFVDGIGDFLFALCRLANQLGVDLEEAWQHSSKDILEKFPPGKEHSRV